MSVHDSIGPYGRRRGVDRAQSARGQPAAAWINGWPLLSEWIFGFIHTTTFGALGALIVWRQPANRLGWLVLAMTLAGAVGAVAFQYGIAATVIPRALPAGALVGGLGFGLLAVPFGVLITLFLLLFPDGHLLSRRWVPVAWVAGAGIALMVVGTTIAAVDLGMRAARASWPGAGSSVRTRDA